MMQALSTTSRHAIPLGVRLDLPVFRGGMRGLGQSSNPSAQDLNQITAEAGSLAATSGSLIATMVGASSVVPLFGAAVAAGVAVAIVIEKIFSGCGQTCVDATNIANQVADKLNQNVQNYFSFPTRYKSMQALHLGVFDSTWNLLLQACGNPALGSAGQRCISERQRGGVAPWCPNPGHTGCDWFVLYRDPIANDPNVLPDPDTSAASAAAPVQMQAVANPDGSVSYVQVPASVGLPAPLLIGLAAIGVALFLMSGSSSS